MVVRGEPARLTSVEELILPRVRSLFHDLLCQNNVDQIKIRHMVEEVDNKLRNHLVEFDLTKLSKLNLLANMWLIFLMCDTEYLLVLLFLFLELFEELVLMAEDFYLFGHICH